MHLMRSPADIILIKVDVCAVVPSIKSVTPCSKTYDNASTVLPCHLHSHSQTQVIMRWKTSSLTPSCQVWLILLIVSPWLQALGKPLAEPPTPVFPDLVPRQTIIPGGKPCGQNNATNRMCWKNNWNITTDYYFTTPPAFNTRVVCSAWNNESIARENKMTDQQC